MRSPPRSAAAGAELVWVGLSTPKQDLWMAEMVERLHRPVVLIGVGAAFEIHAGIRKAPAELARPSRPLLGLPGGAGAAPPGPPLPRRHPSVLGRDRSPQAGTPADRRLLRQPDRRHQSTVRRSPSSSGTSASKPISERARETSR